MDVKLVMFKANGQRKDFPLVRESMVIGRAEDCDLRIPLAKVSRRHCELTVAGDKLAVHDLGSSNGTLVNDKKAERAQLQPGDTLTVGPVAFTVQIDGKPANIQPAKPSQDSRSDEIVDLDAGPVGDEDDVIAALQGGLGDDDHDPIAALEALAGETEKKPKQK